MRRILSIVTLLGFLAVGALAKDNDVVVKTDRFTGKTSVVMKTFRIGPLLGFPDAKQETPIGVSFSLAAEADNSDDPSLVLLVTAADWQFLSGADVHALADGQAIDLGHFVAINGRVSATTVVLTNEELVGRVSRALLDRLANAKDLQIKVGNYEIRLNSKNLEHLRAFSGAIAKK